MLNVINDKGTCVAVYDAITEYNWRDQEVEHATLFREHWGDRCAVYEESCWACRAWRAFDSYWYWVETTFEGITE